MISYIDDKLHYEKFADGSAVCIEDEIPFEIPESWEWCRLSNVIELISGQDLQPSQYNDEGRGILYITGASCIENEKLKKNRWTECPKSISIKNDILISCKGSIGTIAINTEDKVHIARQIMAIRTNIYCYNLFIKILIQNIVPFMQSKSKGVIPGIERKDILDFLVAIPPQSEQQRISETVETLLELVDSIESNKIDLANIIIQTKSKVLDLAIKGKLVPQDPNDEPADKLLERIREEKEQLIKEGKLKRDKNETYIFETYIFKNSDDNSYYEKIDGETVCIDDDLPFEIPDSWRIAKINSIAFVTKLAGFEYTKHIANNLCSEGVPLFKGKNIQDGEIIYKFEHYIPNEVSDNLARSQINKKCILLPYVGTIGNVAIHDKKGKFHLGSNVGKIELFNSLNINILEEYVLYFLRSSNGKTELKKHKKATAQDSISIDAIRDVNMLIPPIQEQYRIVEKIKSIFTQLDIIQEFLFQ